MKKLSLLVKSVVFLGLFTTAFADDATQPAMGYAEKYTGFDMNLGVGYSGFTAKISRSGIPNRLPSSTSYGADGVAAQFKIGGNYGFMDRGLIGLEAYGQYNNAKMSNNFTEISGSSVKRSFSMKWNLGLDLRLGAAFWPSNLIFVYGGPDWAHFDFSYVTPVVNESYTNFKIGGSLGAGIEQMFTDHWTMRVTFDYRWYGTKTYHHANGEQHTVKPKMATAMFMFGYKF